MVGEQTSRVTGGRRLSNGSKSRQQQNLRSVERGLLKVAFASSLLVPLSKHGTYAPHLLCVTGVLAFFAIRPRPRFFSAHVQAV